MQEMTVRDQKSPVVITVPINLRNYFPSHTTRNFFGVINVPFYCRDYHGRLEDIVESVKASFRELLSEESVFKTMNSYTAWNTTRQSSGPSDLEGSGPSGDRYPGPAGRYQYGFQCGQGGHAGIMVPYIEKFSSFMSTNSVQMCISSFQDHLTSVLPPLLRITP